MPPVGGNCGTIASGGTLVTPVSLTTNCDVTGNLTVNSGGSVTMTGAQLKIAGKLVINGTGAVKVQTGGIFNFPQLTLGAYTIQMTGTSSLTVSNSTVITSGTATCTHETLGLTMGINPGDAPTATFTDSSLNTNLSGSGCGSWITANVNKGSTLNVTCSVPNSSICFNAPTELYPADSGIINTTDATFATIYVQFANGTTAGTFNVPNENASTKNYSLAFGPTGTFLYTINMVTSNARLAFESYNGSSVTINGQCPTGSCGAGLKQVPVQFSYYITGGGTLTSLPVNSVLNGSFGTTGTPLCISDVDSFHPTASRTLCMSNLLLDVFAWSIYPSQQGTGTGSAFTINTSFVNELGLICNIPAGSGGLIASAVVNGGTMQYANLAAVVGNSCPGSSITANSVDIWSSPVLAQGGGTISIIGGKIHGVVVQSVGTGSNVTFSGGTVEAFNGNIPHTASPGCATNPPPVDPTTGAPLCNIQNIPTACSTFVTSTGGTITSEPACVPAVSNYLAGTAPFAGPSLFASASYSASPLAPPVGAVLTYNAGTWLGCYPNACTMTHQFRQEGANISGATAATYTLANANFSNIIDITETATANTAIPANNGTGTTLQGVLTPPVVGTTVFYVDSVGGQDTNPGTFASPWKTLAKVNAQSFAACTSVLFKRGDTWRGGTSNAGNNTYSLGALLTPTTANSSTCGVSFDAYGTGAQPVIDGSFDASATGAWTSAGATNVWKSVQTFPPGPEGNITITIANPAVVSFTGGGGPHFAPTATNQSVVISTTGSLPAHITSACTAISAGNYLCYVSGAAGTTFNISATPGGTAISTVGDTQSGTHSIAITGLPYKQANDVANLLYGCSLMGGTNVPPTLLNCSTGRMVGGGTGGVWYLPGEGNTTLTANHTTGQYTFDTDDFTVRTYVAAGVNPATQYSGLSLAIDTACILVQNSSYVTFQNITLQHCGTGCLMTGGTTDFMVTRDLVGQYCGGGNNGGASNADARNGDWLDLLSSTQGWLVERTFAWNMYDAGIGPQSGGPHQDNLTMRNNVMAGFNNDYSTFIFDTPTVNNANYHNNTMCNGNGGWSINPVVQRPNGTPNIIGMFPGIINPVQQGLSILNNVFACIPNFGIEATSWTSGGGTAVVINPFSASGVWLDYSYWQDQSLGVPQQIALCGGTCGPGNPNLAAWAAGTLATPPCPVGRTCTFSPALEPHGQFGASPGFVNQAALNFAPTPVTSPLLNAGKNLCTTTPPGAFAQTIVPEVWDYNKTPRNCSAVTIGAYQQ